MCVEIHHLMCQLSLETASAFEEELIAGFAKICQVSDIRCLLEYILFWFLSFFLFSVQVFAGTHVLSNSDKLPVNG